MLPPLENFISKFTNSVTTKTFNDWGVFATYSVIPISKDMKKSIVQKWDFLCHLGPIVVIKDRAADDDDYVSIIIVVCVS